MKEKGMVIIVIGVVSLAASLLFAKWNGVGGSTGNFLFDNETMGITTAIPVAISLAIMLIGIWMKTTRQKISP
jgi:hypothetical protein